MSNPHIASHRNAMFANAQSAVKPSLIRVAVLLGLCLSLGTYATNYTWTEPAGGDWTTATGWTPGGDPNGIGDTVLFDDLGGNYTVTLNATRTTGGFTLAGVEPTLEVNGQLIQNGGAGTIGGGTLTGTGTVQWRGGAAITWSSANAPQGSLTFLIPNVEALGVVATLDNSAVGSGWGIAAGQTLAFEGNNTLNQNLARNFDISNGFTNSGTIRLGNDPAVDGDSPAPRLTINVADGTLVNTGSGVIAMYPRNTTGESARTPWSERFLNAQIDNQGEINVYTEHGNILKPGAAHSNSGSINLDNSYNVASRLTIQGSSFANSGDFNLSNGQLHLNVATFNYNSGSITGSGMLRMGGGGASDVINWNHTDPTDPVTVSIRTDSRVTLNRTSDWNILAGQTLEFQPSAGSSVTRLNMADSITNNGTLQMGVPTGDGAAVHILQFSSGNFTNASSGIVNMHPRDPSGNDTGPAGYSWSHREIAGEVDNQGQVNVTTWQAYFRKAGAGHVNGGTIIIDSTRAQQAGRTATLYLDGATFTNQPGGVIGGEGIVNVTATTSQTLDNYGTLDPGLSLGTLAIVGNLVLHDSSVLDFEFGPGATSDLITVAGDLTVDGIMQVDGNFLMGEAYTVFNVTGNFVDNGLMVAGYNRTVIERIGNDITIMAIPEPTSLVLIALGSLGLMRRRR